MNRTLIGRDAMGAVVGTGLLVSAVLLIGCGQRADSSKAVTPVSVAGPSVTAPVEAAVQAEPAAAPVTEVAEAAQLSADAAAGTAADAEPIVQAGSCDGEHTVAVPEDLTGQALADALMDQWKRDHPEANWVAEEREKHAFQPPADNSDLLTGDQGKEHVYGNYSERDILIWARETEKLVAEGSRIFHDADALGSTVAVSCDMCHPHAANTHPETYPKFQTQLGRTVLLRDMINWCIENPVRGPKLAADSPEMRALEGYILAQRKGVKMNYGKH